MDKFKFGLFDIFAYTLPGFVVLSTLVACYYDFKLEMELTIKDLFLLLNTLNLYSFIFLFILSYILGYVLHFFGYLYFSFIGKKLWGRSKNIDLQNSPSTQEQKFALVRHFSKENFTYIEQWYAFRGMSFNLSLAFLFLFIVLIIKVINSSLFKFDWIMLSVTCLIFSIVLLRKAITFHCWSQSALNETIKALNLEKNIRAL